MPRTRTGAGVGKRAAIFAGSAALAGFDRDGEIMDDGLMQAHAMERKAALWTVAIGVVALIVNAIALHYYL